MGSHFGRTGAPGVVQLTPRAEQSVRDVFIAELKLALSEEKIMKNEWRDLFNLPPVFLDKTDLFVLEKILCTLQEGMTCEFKIRLTNNAQNIEATSLKELFNYPNLSVSTDKLSIDCYNWKGHGGGRDIVGGISLTLHHNYGSCQIWSSDEEWFIGKREKIKVFFLTKRPWHSLITKVYPFLFPILILLLLQYAAFNFGIKNYFIATSLFILTFLLLFSAYLTYKNVLFPYVKVILAEKDTEKVDLNYIFGIITTIASLFIIIDYIVRLASNFLKK